MAFRGIYSAPKLTPMEFGLFSAAKPEITGTSDIDARWVRGFEVDLESRPNYVRSWSENSATSDVVYSDPNAPYYLEIKPWFIEVEDHATTMGLLGLNRFERVLRQLEGVTQRTVEREFWEGNIAQGEGLSNPYLRNADTVTILNGGNALPPHHAIAYLERAISEHSAAGEQGVLHMTRDVATLLGSQYMLTRVEDDPGHIHIETNGGTTVVLGAGYTGNGPIGATGATATDTSKWIYATGTVAVRLGESEVVNDNLAQAYDVANNNNDMRIKATRPVAAYFDTSIHLAVKVDLSTSAI
jgi:hypothetical protein